MKYKRIFTIVIDSLGVGSMEDADQFDDIGSDTFGHINDVYKNLKIDTLKKLGLYNMHPNRDSEYVYDHLGYTCKLKELSNGKDTLSGHYEMMGIIVENPFLTYTEHGFPQNFIKALEKAVHHKIVGNCAASGTQIIQQYGNEIKGTNSLIVYTSSDSVLQIAADENEVGLEELYRCCEIARKMTYSGDVQVARVIARPYIQDENGNFVRTSNRHDYAIDPPTKSYLDCLKDHGYDVIGIGKIRDIFNEQGISEYQKSKSSIEGMKQTLAYMDRDFTGLCFVNLVDFDMLWGHRRDVQGYAHELENFDLYLKQCMDKLHDDDLLMICADHGNDPTYKGSDHTREYVPLLVYSKSMSGHGNLGIRHFSDIGASIIDNFELVDDGLPGESLLKYMK